MKNTLANSGLCGPRVAWRRLNLSIKARAAEGFTLIELMVTIAIAAILLSLAVPSFQAMVMNNRLTAQAGGLNTALNYARNTALSQAVNVVVCPVGALGSTTCGASWGTGWMVVRDPAGTPTLLQSQLAPSSNAVLSSPATSVVFGPRGLAGTVSSFKVCDSRGAAFARSVQVLATGFVQAGATPGQVAWGSTALTCP
jgi:type IV fimbrial biogenesis protein FimT